MYSWPSTSVMRAPLPWAMNGGYGFQPNLTVRALLPAPPGMIALAALNSSPERAAKRGYSVWKSISTSRRCWSFLMLSLLGMLSICLLYTSDAADEEDSVDLGGRRIIK